MSYSQLKFAAAQRLKEEIAKPLDDGAMDDGVFFDPWNLFPSLYGSYSGEFDWCAVGVLEKLGVYDGSAPHDLASEMIREMLCTGYICEYGSSPRVCFPSSESEPFIRPLIEKWKQYYEIEWGEPFPLSKAK